MRYGFRKRKRSLSDGEEAGPALDRLTQVQQLAAASRNVIIFSGSGVSANCGMSTFSTKGGLYERAQKRFGVSDGKKLFTYSFFEKHKLEALAFFAEIYAEAKRARPGPGHRAMKDIANVGKLLRQYSMNIDGLSEQAGLDTWHATNNPSGCTVEIHGNISQLVCPECGAVTPMNVTFIRQMRTKKPIPCTMCSCQAIRCRVMLYGDADGLRKKTSPVACHAMKRLRAAKDDVITPEDVFDLMEEDLKVADLILWVGISFEQSASTAYFRRVRSYLMEAGRLHAVRQVLINTSEDAFWNLMSSSSNIGSLDVLELLGSSDDVLPILAAAMVHSPAPQQAMALAGPAVVATAAAVMVAVPMVRPGAATGQCNPVAVATAVASAVAEPERAKIAQPEARVAAIQHGPKHLLQPARPSRPEAVAQLCAESAQPKAVEAGVQQGQRAASLPAVTGPPAGSVQPQTMAPAVRWELSRPAQLQSAAGKEETVREDSRPDNRAQPQYQALLHHSSDWPVQDAGVAKTGVSRQSDSQHSAALDHLSQNLMQPEPSGLHPSAMNVSSQKHPRFQNV